MRWLFPFLAVSAVLFLSPARAQTHGYAIRSAEADSSVLATPAAVSLSGEIVLNQSTSTSLVSGNAIGCTNPSPPRYTADNLYTRIFDLSEVSGIEEGLAISEVSFGIEEASAPDGEQPATLRFYTIEGDVGTFSKWNLEAEVDLTLQNQTLSIQTVQISEVFIPAGAVFGMSLLVPNGVEDQHKFFIGSNAEGESAPTYLLAPSCNIDDPTPMDEVAPKSDVHWVLSVTGTSVSVASEETPGDRRITLGNSFPNPVTPASSLTVPFTLGESGMVHLALLDVLGREVATVAERAFAAGDNTVEVSTAELPAGRYVIRLEAEGSVRSTTFTVAR